MWDLVFTPTRVREREVYCSCQEVLGRHRAALARAARWRLLHIEHRQLGSPVHERKSGHCFELQANSVVVTLGGGQKKL